MVHSGDCQLLSPVILPIAQWVHQQMAVVMVAEMGFMHGLDNTDYHSPRLTWLCPYWSILVMGWPFFAHNASAKATICALTEYHCHGIPHHCS